MIHVGPEVIDPQEILRFVSGEAAGAVASFFGTVRDRNAGKEVVAVEYHAYPSMAAKTLEEIAREMGRGFGVLQVALVHRTGRLGIGEISVGIAAGAPHRHQALGAVAYAIERVKLVAPIWKHELYRDGSAWLEPSVPERRGEGGGSP